MSADCPAAWLLENARERGSDPALICGGETLDWHTLARRAAFVAGHLPEARAVAVSPPRAVDGVVALFAAPLAGRALVPLDPDLSDQRRAGLLAATGAVPFDGPWAGEAEPPEQPKSAPTDVQVIVATSGSGGAPKGVMLTGANLAAAVRASRARLGLEAGDRWLCCLPLVHVGGLSIPLRCAEVGAAILLHDGFDAVRAWRALEDGGVTHVSLVPAMLARLLDVAGGPPPPRLRRVLVGGAALSADLARRARAAGWPLSPSWGMSETASQAATLATFPDDWHPGLAGPPLPGLEVAVGGDGRLRLRGPMVMAGYANPDLRPGDGLEAGGWFVSGDLGRLDGAGRVVVSGRADHVLVSGGECVDPEEVEGLLAACPGVTGAGITASSDPVWGDVLVALVTGAVTETAVLAWCRDNLAGALRPRRVVVVTELRRTALGKLDRAALRDRVTGPCGTPPTHSPGD